MTTSPVEYLPADRIIAAQREPFSAANPYALGYGRKIPTDRMVKLDDGRARRVYVMQFSNAGSAYVLDHGKELFIGPEAEERMDLLTGLGWPSVYWGKLDPFTRQYLETALWSSNDESDESGGDPMDANYGIEDISPATLAEAVADCAAFRRTPEYLEFMRLFEAEELEPFRADTRGDNGLDGSMGHDFWLTRNGHGAGFWDGDYPDPWGDKLTEAAKRFGEIDLTVYRGVMPHTLAMES